MRCPRCGAENPGSGSCSSCQTSAAHTAIAALTPSPDNGPTGGLTTAFGLNDSAPTMAPGGRLDVDDGDDSDDGDDGETVDETRAQPVKAAASRARPKGRASAYAAADPEAGHGPLTPGQAFGSRYHIIRILGMGGMGAVYHAWDAELGVAVAIKIIRPEIMADPATAAEVGRRFKRELLLARQVTHKNVVRIHDLGEIDGIKYITMPYVDGADLSTIRLRDGKMPVSRVLRIARSVIGGLVEAHKAGVVHRDLKPAN